MMETKTVYPWQTTQWQQLIRLHQQQLLPHAFLFSGIAGIGKKHFANQFAQALLCLSPNAEGYSCQQCRGCHLVQAKSHPDLLYVEPQENGQIIKVDQVRELVEFVGSTSLQNGYRIVIVDPAHAMNLNAANALLKTLEEPGSNTLFILISDRGSRLPATIRSRCQKIEFHKPDKTIALQWMKENNIEQAELLLRLAQGAPFKALAFLENDLLAKRNQLYQGLIALTKREMDPLQFAQQWQEIDLAIILNLLQHWIQDLTRMQLTNDDTMMMNVDFQEPLKTLAQNNSVGKMIEYVDCIQKTNAATTSGMNLNRQLVLEELFIKWVHHAAG